MRHRLLAWYAEARRPLPWREQRDPYRIWLSEVMLQQTRVETVLPYYRAFLERFPTLSDLAAATEEEVLRFWQGLGYYSRARSLHGAVREVAARYGGRVPDDPEAFRSLPGVGDYTAGAVLSIGYGRPLPAVDGNVLRVLSRLRALDEPIDGAAGRRIVAGWAARLVPEERPGDWNQALMELGATVCTPAHPRCEACPVAGLCAAHREGRAASLPARRPRRPPRPVAHPAALVWREEPGGEAGAGEAPPFLLRRRPPGLLGGLWELPGVDLDPGEAERTGWRAALERGLWEEAGLRVEVGRELHRLVHVFSHVRWELRAFSARWLGGGLPSETRWVRPAELPSYPLPTAFARLLGALGLGGEEGGGR